MPKEKWTVFYKVEDAGAQPYANWKEKTVKTKAGEKNNGLVNSDTEPSRSQENAQWGYIANTPLEALFVTIEAEGAEEACYAVASFYGKDLAQGKLMACLSANLTEAQVQ